MKKWIVAAIAALSIAAPFAATPATASVVPPGGGSGSCWVGSTSFPPGYYWYVPTTLFPYYSVVENARAYWGPGYFFCEYNTATISSTPVWNLGCYWPWYSSPVPGRDFGSGVNWSPSGQNYYYGTHFQTDCPGG
jgi:hypothetical protein